MRLRLERQTKLLRVRQVKGSYQGRLRIGAVEGALGENIRANLLNLRPLKKKLMNCPQRLWSL